MHPLAHALLLASAFSMSQVSHAVTIVDDQLNIGQDTPLDSYRVNRGAELVAEGATTERIDVRAGTLRMGS
ncbi:hypothetical protein [Pseudomonas sp. Irchel 3F3]|uniref:hypothetical protein n=1 Tax=Pseudomonas sp. Irchel 3F3 TaxID=2009000 RepID=UPI000BA3683B|nr:hypothetical protein [Pseudomonas sp. Irchel 3F3]